MVTAKGIHAEPIEGNADGIQFATRAQFDVSGEQTHGGLRMQIDRIEQGGDSLA